MSVADRQIANRLTGPHQKRRQAGASSHRSGRRLQNNGCQGTSLAFWQKFTWEFVPRSDDDAFWLDIRITHNKPVAVDGVLGPFEIVPVDRTPIDDNAIGDVCLPNLGMPLDQLRLPAIKPDKISLQKGDSFAGNLFELSGEIEIDIEPTQRVTIYRFDIAEYDIWETLVFEKAVRRLSTHLLP